MARAAAVTHAAIAQAGIPMLIFVLNFALFRTRVSLAQVFGFSLTLAGVALTAARGARWQVEHMESWSVAAAAEAAGVPFVALLGITNEVGPEAHAQWLANRAAVESAVRDAARSLLGDS